MKNKFNQNEQTNNVHSGPIFILGSSQRSGTNFLHDLINLHPDCGAHPTVWEDFIVNYLDLLKKYSDSVSNRWKWREGQVEESVKVNLSKYLGNGIVDFLSSELPEGKRLVTKTPSIHNIHLFSKFFPDSYMLILIRDGRSVVESLVRTFHGSYETAMYGWATAAKEVVCFENNFQHSSSRHLIVKYEDLYENLESELKKIFSFLKLDARKYDFAAALNNPVRGSSTFKNSENGLTWQPVKKTTEFNPLRRWSNWSRQLHEMFNHLGGEQLRYFGYKEIRFDNRKVFWGIRVRFWSINRIRRFYTHLISLHIKNAVKRYLGEGRVEAVRKYLKWNVKR